MVKGLIDTELFYFQFMEKLNCGGVEDATFSARWNGKDKKRKPFKKKKTFLRNSRNTILNH